MDLFFGAFVEGMSLAVTELNNNGIVRHTKERAETKDDRTLYQSVIILHNFENFLERPKIRVAMCCFVTRRFHVNPAH